MAARWLGWNVVWSLNSFPPREYYCQSRYRRKGKERDAEHPRHVILRSPVFWDDEGSPQFARSIGWPFKETAGILRPQKNGGLRMTSGSPQACHPVSI